MTRNLNGMRATAAQGLWVLACAASAAIAAQGLAGSARAGEAEQASPHAAVPMAPTPSLVTIGRPPAPGLVVRLNEVALERLGPKVAVVEASEALDATGAGRAHFKLTRDGAVVLQGPLTRLPAFQAWGPGRRYFAADFSALAEDGVYRVEAFVGGRRAVSAPVKVGVHALFAATAAQLLDYFHANRHVGEGDRHIRIFDTDRFVDVWGGWKDAGGDTGKYLSHLSYANFFNPQQAPLVTWVLAKTYDSAPALYAEAKLDARVLREVFWGADYLHRILDPEGYFYLTVFDKWGTDNAERMVTGFEGLEGNYTRNYKAAFRAGGGAAIAALARASMLAQKSGQQGEFAGVQYLADAERAFDHLQRNNTRYCADGTENIIDDYTALIAATELLRATEKPIYLEAARLRAQHLYQRMTPQGWFVSDAGSRPYYHGVEAGMPVISLVNYLELETDVLHVQQARQTVAASLKHQLALNQGVANPYNYARQTFSTYKKGQLSPKVQTGFFMPHDNETQYWWQGESASLASLSAAAVMGGRLVAAEPRGSFGVSQALAEFAQNQMDWTLGRNPYGITLLYGFGSHNPPSAESAGEMVVGGISNGITGATLSATGAGITFAPGPDENQWRWVEQWLPHSTWFLLAAVTLAQ
ncbi:glycoside hydrolase family 9 protein [Roseateles koreensis]|uniref:Glycoside hydrolase family 9 protein n=1 Tax=Roseateles koreensis TaxID=2987526 RepID=A0ABT5KMT7_9BURK|nr:glycoside hydrolase family 9 protein [Roseateles koreensis]MDC8784230.1 glycoside hydrolase family 9 protein [Roseateles koreensis]